MPDKPMKDEFESLESLKRATRNQVDTITFMRANMKLFNEWNKQPIRRIINFLKKIKKWLGYP